jgi:alcohol dehydrogenase class IV
VVELGFPRRIILGESAPDALAQILEQLGARRIIIITDKIISNQKFYNDILNKLSSGFEVSVFSEVEPEPSIDTAVKAAQASSGVDAIIAVGGGSVIDVAKAAGVLVKRPGVRIEDIAPFNVLGVEYEKPYLIVVPTTAGTGSDASYGIVLSKREEGYGKVKIAVGSYEVIPHVSVLDHSIPRSAPKRIIVGAMVDALSHALESLASTASNPLSEALAEKAAVIILTIGPRALLGDDEAWLNVHAAATMAGIAFSNSGLGLAHAIAHPLGGLLGLHHGTTVGVVLPSVMRLYMRDERVRKKYDRLKAVLETAYGLEARPTLVDHVLEFYHKIGQPARFRELGVEEQTYHEAAAKAAELAYHDPDIAFSPVIPEPGDLLDLIWQLY